MWKQTVAAILYTGLRIGKITTAGTALVIQRAVAKHTVKVLRIRTLVAGKYRQFRFAKYVWSFSLIVMLLNEGNRNWLRSLTDGNGANLLLIYPTGSTMQGRRL